MDSDPFNGLIYCIIGLPIVLAFHYTPTIIAWRRHHRHLIPIAIANTLLSWTVIGWAGCLIWATWPEERF